MAEFVGERRLTCQVSEAGQSMLQQAGLWRKDSHTIDDVEAEVHRYYAKEGGEGVDIHEVNGSSGKVRPGKSH